MIFSIGYQGFKSVDELAQVLKSHQVEILLDVRSKPHSRFKPHFGRKCLSCLLPGEGICYEWAGEQLGGFGEITDQALQDLAGYASGKVVCLMCMEADPDRCHRKNEIARRLESRGVTVHHLRK